MPKECPDNTHDALLDEIATCTRLDITSDVGTPANLTNSLANVTLTAGDGNGDFTIGDGDTSGRKLTVAAQSGASIGSTGDARHYVLSLSGTIKYVTTCTQQTLTSGGTVDIPAFTVENRDPT